MREEGIVLNSVTRQSDGKFLSKLFMRVLPAQIFLLLLACVSNIVDGLVGSHFFGRNAMEIIGLYEPFQMIWVAVSTILSVGSQVLCARYMGAGDLNRTRGVFSLALTVGLGITVVATLLSFLLPSRIAEMLGAAPGATEQLSGFIIGRGIGLIPMMISSLFVAFLALEGQNKLNYIATGILVFVNTGLDFLFASAMKNGVMSLGIAASLSQWIYMMLTGWFFLTKKASMKFSMKLIRWEELWQMMKVGGPSAIAIFLCAFRHSLYNKALGAYDPSMVLIAAISTFSMILMIFEAIGMGVAATGRLLASVSYGEEDGRTMAASMKLVFTKGMLILAAACAALFLLAGPATGLFYPDPSSEVYGFTVRALQFGVLVLIFETITAVFANYFQAVGRNVIVNIISIMQGIGLLLPLGLILIPKAGFNGAMLAYVIGHFVNALIGPVYAFLYWKRRPKTISEWVTIPADFGARDEERIDVSIHSLEDAVAAAKEVRRFCERRNLDEKKSYYSALAVEELCIDIIRDRFDEKDKKHTIEVRVVHKDDNIFMSLKDDCRPFNAQERAELVRPEDDSERSMNIRVFMGIVRETEYQLTLGINVFTATI